MLQTYLQLDERSSCKGVVIDEVDVIVSQQPVKTKAKLTDARILHQVSPGLERKFPGHLCNVTVWTYGS